MPAASWAIPGSNYARLGVIIKPTAPRAWWIGCLRVAEELALKGIQVSSGGVRGVWSRHNFLTRHERLLRLEKTVSKQKIELSDEQVRLLERFSPEFRERHIYNTKRPHQGRNMKGRTPYKAFMDGLKGLKSSAAQKV